MSLAPHSEAGPAAEPTSTNPVPSIGLSVSAVAVALIVVSGAARAAIAWRGYLAVDDFPLISMAEKNGLEPEHLFALFNNHLMPAGQLVTWLTHRLGGFGYGPYLTLLVAAQAAVCVAFYRLLRLMLVPGWGVLVPLTVFAFSPLTLEATSWWAVGVNMLPMQLAMILAAGAQVKYMRTRAPRHLVSLGLAVLLGLVFFEKAILSVALVFLMTLCLYSRGGPFRSLWSTIRTWWQSWAVLTFISVTFLLFYLSQSTSSLRKPSSVDEVLTFLTQMFGHTLLPGLVGGPWSWLAAGDGAPITAPSVVAKWTALAVVLGFIGFTVWLRGAVAGRAWLLVLLYTSLVAGMLGATRLGSVFSGVAGAVPRYIADVVVVAGIAIGVALCGLRSTVDDRSPVAAPRWTALANSVAASKLLVGGLAVLLVSTALTAVRFGDQWSVKEGRDYLNTALAELAQAPAGTVFMDQAVPEGVVGPLSAPYNKQSEFFAPVENGPIFVTESRNLSVFDEEGHIRPAWVDGVTARPGPRAGCGYRLTGSAVPIPLTESVVDYWHVIRIAYLSDRDSAATLRLGAGPIVPFDVHRGLNAMFMLARGGGDSIELSVADTGAGFCTDEIAVGRVVPAPR